MQNRQKSSLTNFIEKILLQETITIDKFAYGNTVELVDLSIFKGEIVTNIGKFDISIFPFERK